MLPKRKKNRTALEDNNQSVVPTVLYGPPSFFSNRPKTYTMPNPALRKKQEYCPQCGYELKKEGNLI